MGRSLTLMERKFINTLVANNGKRREAYFAAGYSKKSSEATIDVVTHEILQRPKVKAELERRYKEIEKASQIQFETKKLELWDMAKSWRQSGDVRAGVAAVNEINRMEGHHAAQSLFVRSEQFVFDQSMGLESDPIEGEAERVDSD